jgi:ferritin-like metal-binding protein YciE
MSKFNQKVVQYLNEAHASEIGLVSVLESQIAMTPRGSYRDGLEKHLDETRDHARRVQERLGELEQGWNPLQVMVGFGEMLISQTLALSKTPFDLMRGTSGEEKVLKNAKDACATEALEIATYTALERLADKVGDERTAKLAASILRDEERMLQRILREIPKLTDAVVRADIKGEPSYDVATTGAADTARQVEREVRRTARKAQSSAKRSARQARKAPAAGQTERQTNGAVASEEGLPIERYDSLTAEEVVAKLSKLSQIDLAKVDSYERSNQSRATVLSRVSALRGREPWPGYDELTVAEIEAVLDEGDEQRAEAVLEYERSHKDRAGVITSAQRETANA